MKTTIRIYHEKEFFDNHENAEDIQKGYLFIEMKERSRLTLDQ